jgi:hypothetical protein
MVYRALDFAIRQSLKFLAAALNGFRLSIALWRPFFQPGHTSGLSTRETIRHHSIDGIAGRSRALFPYTLFKMA